MITFPSSFKARLQRSQRGQSILLLAIGFIALAAFVGLVTDLSIMFVRYSTLRKAVDSAAVAAAGQIREGTNYGRVAATARQYIRLHGLDPTSVWVETCETDIATWRETHPEPEPLTNMAPTELCDWEDPRKLVKVTAQIRSETTFLKLVGIQDVTLTSEAVSESAPLDVALVIDTSASMANLTTLQHYLDIGLGLPGDLTPDDMTIIYDDDIPVGNGNGTVDPGEHAMSDRKKELLDIALDSAQYEESDIRYGCLVVAEGDVDAGRANLQYGGCCSDPGNGDIFWNEQTEEWAIYTDQNANGEYDEGIDALGVTSGAADGNYNDMICQPFKQVKDAARNFVQQLDFVRGDRVALVTFDYQAKVYTLPDTEIGMMNDIGAVMDMLDIQIGVSHNRTQTQYSCKEFDEAYTAAEELLNNTVDPRNHGNFLLMNQERRPWAYESWAPCSNTNIGDGILQANRVLTDPDTIRRDAVWVTIILSDGEANASRGYTTQSGEEPDGTYAYRDYGFCPWATFCEPNRTRQYLQVGQIFMCDEEDCTYPPNYEPPIYEECAAVRDDPNVPKPNNPILCNDNIDWTRHFCLVWSNNRDLNALPPPTIPANSQCGPRGSYDADDYARDMADFAGLVEVAPGVPGNFITMYSIGFGELVATSEIAAPLLRYIADAGDNGYIDNNMHEDWREHKDRLVHGINGPWPDSYGEQDPCYGVTDSKEWCGNYYYAQNLSELDAVFEAIADRLFTRIAR